MFNKHTFWYNGLPHLVHVHVAYHFTRGKLILELHTISMDKTDCESGLNV